jgi:invasion protein IalB
MYDLFKPALLALLLAGSTAVAQEAETPQEDAPAASEEVDAGPADLSLGEPVAPQAPAVPTSADEVAIGQPYVPTFFGDWAFRCLNAGPEQNDPCQLYQLLRDGDDNAVAEISLFPLAPGGQAAAGATIVVPLETLLTQQLTMSVDDGPSRRYPFTFCNAGGCVARVGFTQEEVNQFKRGNNATIRLVPAAAPEEEVILTVSLTGFTAALDATEDSQ